MESFNFLFIFAALIIGAMFFVVNIQRNEQKKADKLNQAAKHKYRANEAANILSNFSKIPIGEETRKILLQVIQKNLVKVLDIQPKDDYVRKRLPAINKQLANITTKIDSNQLVIPTDPQQLEKLINSLTKLTNYIIKISKSYKLDLTLAKGSIDKISSLMTEIKLTAYIQQIKKGLANNNHDFAVKRLITTKQLISGLENKSQRIIALQNRLANLEQELKVSFQKAKKTSKKEETSGLNEETNEAVNSVFGPKKKW